jgi:hypothetical protein
LLSEFCSAIDLRRFSREALPTASEVKRSKGIVEGNRKNEGTNAI